MYQRQGAPAFKKNLKNIRALVKILGNPEKSLSCIHIAGTNGKGTTAHIMASILQEKGLCVGVYTSPHYLDFRERIKINGQYISKNDVVKFVQGILPYLNDIKASFFEITVAMAFDYFARQNVDIAVIETGLGGRLDSTNIIDPLLSIITNISLDHQSMLGDTIPKIAYEKAGIIKKNKPVLIGESQKLSLPVFKKKASQVNAKVFYAQKMIRLKEKEIYYSDQINLPESLIPPGPFQTNNTMTALAGIKLLEKQNKIRPTSKTEIKNGLRNLNSNTKYQGRWQVLSKKPLIVVDSAHNEGGLQKIFSEISQLEIKKLHIILGFVNDKSLDNILGYFPVEAKYYFVQANIPRALPKEKLKEKAQQFQLDGKTYRSVKRALAAAKRSAKTKDAVFVLGSIFVAAEALT